MTRTKASQSPAAPVFVPDFCAPAARRFVLIAAILASALGFIDGTVVAIALPAMRSTLEADLVQAQWIHNAYMLTLSALILAGGALGDRLGLARVFGGGIALFVLASLACAAAPTAGFMIGARMVQGMGAAIMVPGSLAIIARAYPRAERGRAIGIWAAASALTTAAGPIIGGLALSLGGPEMWRAIFAINLPLGGLALWLLWTKVGADPARSDTPPDLLGAATATLALLCIAWGLTQLGHQGGSAVAVWLVAGVLLLGVFLWIETRVAAPMMPLSLFANRIFSAANLMAFVLYSALNIMFFFMPMTFIAGWGYSEIDAAATFAPMSVFISLLSARAGRLADRIGPAPLLVTGSLIAGMGYAAMGYFAPEQDLWARALPAMGLVGLGMALVVAPLSTAVMGAVREDQSGVASGVNNAVTRMAGLISVAAVGGLVAGLYARAGGVASFGLPSDSAGHVAAMNNAFAGLAYLAAGLCLASAAVAFFGIRQPKQD
ncbi:MFS transporter [Sulfitobacter delicatus]|uniref:Drug resistance transporter, EmrB/QacA subfamily n=1 Tax=Sulfitobacter delicatus TaxID=218672 RepID=A0A1G7PMZ9_9RHOB|nr:MFS transporter [Sulfitobacter delicatus]SDF87782.1 drug resistance transporter, EmrB/QacA subfamily [Sulfitobacter delicatus]